jgi:hypothetical protein
MIGPRLPNKPPDVSKGGIWVSCVRNIVRGAGRRLKKGARQVMRIAPGLFGMVDGTGYARACLKEEAL